ncbi:EAL domain-containing protein [Methylibium sp.]|uniref:EAL domain-containing protein n=1 Tax=Methylibium sp. TaxID=2067992 RepID=UPI003D0E08D8
MNQGEPQQRNPALAGELGIDAYRLLVEQAPVAMFVVQASRLRLINSMLAALFGYTIGEMLDGLDPADLVAPEDRARIAEQIQRREAGLRGRSQDIECLRKDGSCFSARLWSARFELEGSPADLITLHDVSELKRIASTAQQREQLLAQTEELALIGSSEYDVATDTVKQSAGMFRIFGEPFVDDRVGGEWLMARVPSSEEAFVRMILQGVRPGEPCEFEHRIVHADGNLRTVLHRATAEAGGQGHGMRVISILQDITAQRLAEHQRDQFAQSDVVTRLPNRNALLDHLERTVLQAQRESREVALLALEIDHLKIVSDSFGYGAADLLLAAIGERLSSGVLAQHMLAHLGSGRYAVPLIHAEDVSEATALAAAQAVVEAFSVPFMVEDTEVLVSCAVGLALFPRDAECADQLLHQAQAAMHRAREQGDNHVCVYTTDANAKAAARLAMEAALRRALEKDEFYLHYQPQLDLASGALIGVEALLRWTDPVRGQISPTEFIPLAEETGLILPIGDWVLRTACAQNLAWQRAGLAPIRVAVNLSVRQFEQPDLARRIQQVLLETGLDPHDLGVEITESVMMIDGTHVARTLGELKALGVEISLDDFGTGYSNLSYLRTLPIDVVKIDRSLVHDVTAAPQDVSMARAVINMAHGLRMKVLAEGVETEGQLALLISNGCDQMQGYFFSKPVAAGVVAGMLQERRQLPEHLLQRRQRNRTLLLVDDEDNVVSALKRLLRRDGYHIVTASSGAQGLQRLAEQAIDVIVSDQRMPGMTGVEFLRRAKDLYPDTVRMVLSGYTELQSITDAINEGAIYKFLTKPWDDERLRGHISEAFRQKEMSDENRRLGAQVQIANQELAKVNQRLQRLLDTQNERMSREEISLGIAHDMLQNMPTPVIGIDLEGMIAFANADAETLFSRGPSLLGRFAPEALPADLLKVLELGDGAHHGVSVDGHAYLAACRSLNGASSPRGKLLVLAPGVPVVCH